MLWPDGPLQVVARDVALAGISGDLVITRRADAPDATSLGLAQAMLDGLRRYALALPAGWRLAQDGRVVGVDGGLACVVHGVAARSSRRSRTPVDGRAARRAGQPPGSA